VKSPERTKKTLRLPQSLNKELEKCAAQNGRSLNAEIIQRLLRSFEGYTR